MFGIFLMLIGLVWLLQGLGIITTAMSQLVWPIVLIALGFAIMFKKPWNHSHRHWMGYKDGKCCDDNCCDKKDDVKEV